MSSVFRTAVLATACGAVACGAIRANPGSPTAGAPASTRAPIAERTQVNSARARVVPAGQELDVRLQSSLSSETAKVEQRFQTTTIVDVVQNRRVLIPAGSVVRGVVSAVDPAGRGLDRKGSLTLGFDQMTVNGRRFNIRGMATQVFESRGIREEAGTAGAGAGVGGIVGGILGGVKGAVLGAIIGAGGAIVATDGKDIELPAGSIVRMRFDAPVNVR